MNTDRQTQRARLRETLLAIHQAGLAAVAPDGAVLRHLKLHGDTLTVLDEAENAVVAEFDLAAHRRLCVLGAGKGAAPMAYALQELLGDHIDDGLVIVKYDHVLPKGQTLRRIALAEASHPVPDEAGLKAARELVERARSCSREDLVLCVFTGGASALTPALQPGISLADMQGLTQALLACGATIHEINSLRKHLSVLSGGSLARAVAPAQGLGLIVSDVIGDDLDVIASGPTVPDKSSFADCAAIVARYHLEESLPGAVAEHLHKGLQGLVPETPKQDDPAFATMRNVLVATLAQALAAAADKARELGYTPRILTDKLCGEARDEARLLIEEARAVQKTLAATDKPVCLLAGGETTVTLRGHGRGGRNQEMALAASLELANDQGIHCLFAGTDGTDGPTDAAGGFAFSQDMERWQALGLNAAAYLAENDSYACLEKAGTLLKTGPTRTNVMDAAMLLVYPRQN